MKIFVGSLDGSVNAYWRLVFCVTSTHKIKVKPLESHGLL